MSDQTAGKIVNFRQDIPDIDDIANQNLRLAQYDDRLAAHRAMLALDAGRMGSWHWELTTGKITGDPLAADLMLLDFDRQPWPQVVGYSTIHPDDLEWVSAMSQKALDKTDSYEAVFRRVSHDGKIGGEDEFWLGVRGRVTRRDNDGKPLEMLGVNWDATKQKQQEAQLRLLAAEMDHRIKNAFAIVQSLINIGSQTAQNTASFADTLRHQVQAMADTHSLSARLSRQPDAHQIIPVGDVIRQALNPWINGYANPNGDITVTVDIEDEIAIASDQISTFAMIIYELTTNATKYGALAHQFGRLDASIKWTAKDAFAFEWREHGPRASINTAQWSKGFGSTLIDYCTRTLDAELEREILETGVSYKMTIPL